jgi:hypothetical protein
MKEILSNPKNQKLFDKFLFELGNLLSSEPKNSETDIDQIQFGLIYYTKSLFFSQISSFIIKFYKYN